MWMLVLFWTAFPFGELFAQGVPHAVIAGRISDAETGSPIENAIVFLSNTPIGTSSASDGTFRISFVPAGVFQMVIARIGYEHELISLNVTKAESLYYQIKLQPQPIRTSGVEVYGKPPEEVKPNLTLFFPKDSPGTYCLYGAANTMPIGIFFSDSAFYMYSLETAIVDSEKYIRLWLLYLNLSQTPYDFDPLKCTKLHMSGKRTSYKDVSPDAPEKMLTVVKKTDAMDLISKTIGSQLRALAARQTEFEWEDYYADLLRTHTVPINWAKEGVVVRPFRFSPSRKGSMSSDLYSIFEKSLKDGILKRYTVFPDKSVNGYIYFAFPGLNWKATAPGFPEAAEYSYTIEIITQSGSKLIQFVPQ